MPDPIAEAYADCIHLHCGRCNAQPDDYCTNPITRQHSATPCWTRMHAAERPPSARAQQAIERENQR